jgi:hypothetical protein
VRASTSQNPIGLQGLFQGYLYLYLTLVQQVRNILYRRFCNPNCKRKRRITESHSPYSAVVLFGTFMPRLQDSHVVYFRYSSCFLFRYRHMYAELTITCNNDLGQYAIIFRKLFLNDLYGANICNHYYIKNAHIMIEVVICS